LEKDGKIVWAAKKFLILKKCLNLAAKTTFCSLEKRLVFEETDTKQAIVQSRGIKI